MLSGFRAGLLAAATIVGAAILVLPASAADKAFTNDDLANSAVELEAQIKADAGTPVKTVDQLRHDADAAFPRTIFAPA